jgi:RNA polymerase sigma-70 factor (ECF subfamily)
VELGERFLVRRLRQGDRDACRELIGAHHGSVYGYLRRLGADAPLAEDLSQETYAKAWRSIESLREASSLRSWLLTIARNEYFQWRRNERAALVSLEAAPAAEADRPPADRQIAASERGDELRRAVGRLEPDLRETIALHYFQELSLREVGAVLGVPAGTVKSRLNRALACLRSLLEKGVADHESQRAEKAVASRS